MFVLFINCNVTIVKQNSFYLIKSGRPIQYSENCELFLNYYYVNLKRENIPISSKSDKYRGKKPRSL